MKFQRNLRIAPARFDVAPYLTVFFLLAMFLLLARILPTPGLQLQLPMADGLSGPEGPIVNVAVDVSGRFYFKNRIVTESELKSGLLDARHNSPGPLTLVVQADKSVPCESLVRLTMLARDAGIKGALLATLPSVWGSANSP